MKYKTLVVKKKFALQVEPDDTFENVKAKIQDLEEIPSDLCELYHNDTLLDNESTVSDLGLENGSSLLFFLSFEKVKAKMDKEKAKEKAGEGAEKAKTAQIGQNSWSGNPALVSKKFWLFIFSFPLASPALVSFI